VFAVGCRIPRSRESRHNWRVVFRSVSRRLKRSNPNASLGVVPAFPPLSYPCACQSRFASKRDRYSPSLTFPIPPHHQKHSNHQVSFLRIFRSWLLLFLLSRRGLPSLLPPSLPTRNVCRPVLSNRIGSLTRHPLSYHRSNFTTVLPDPSAYWAAYEQISELNVHLNIFERLWAAWYQFMDNDTLATGSYSLLRNYGERDPRC
jgi:hypothetical protein